MMTHCHINAPVVVAGVPVPSVPRSLRVRLGLLLLLSAGLCSHLDAHAQDLIYRCQDEQGQTVFQNVGRGRHCERVDIAPVLTVPAPRLPSRSAVGAVPAANPAGGTAGSNAAATRTATSASFPRVDVSTQKFRDDERRRILEDELQLERERLARLQGEYHDGAPQPLAGEPVGSPRYQERLRRLHEDIERTTGNVASLERELTPLRY